MHPECRHFRRELANVCIGHRPVPSVNLRSRDEMVTNRQRFQLTAGVRTDQAQLLWLRPPQVRYGRISGTPRQSLEGAWNVRRPGLVNANARVCLYCDKPADSMEHVFPEGLGGRAPQLILCRKHNGEVARKCDEPLIESLDFFVHVFKIKRKGGTRGISIAGKDTSGVEFRVDEEFKPRLAKGTTILERDANDRPVKFSATDMSAANKLIKSMKLPPDAPISTERRTMEAPQITFSLQFGGAQAFRGILKIAYELARGLLGGTILSADADADAGIRSALLDEADPMPFVKWLPYDKIPSGLEDTAFSSRIIAWQSDAEVLAIVEFFNCLPFVVRLPGVLIPSPALYVQSVQGGEPYLVNVDVSVPWIFADIPDHAQPQIMEEFPRYFNPIMELYTINQLLTPIANATGERFMAKPNGSNDEIARAVLTDLRELWGRELTAHEDQAAKAIIYAVADFLRANRAQT